MSLLTVKLAEMFYQFATDVSDTHIIQGRPYFVVGVTVAVVHMRSIGLLCFLWFPDLVDVIA